ncbi:hypothetical protein [Thalassomonas sp. RHCl1]|uniref:hypothetical protein n=1 Tax=Thalassomonas sp. RHCl1 TaxID=2995320 RepID=UPI00248D1357|nr:hypothetical protein [Thalassomonas sp. RHCl1]
MQNIQMFNQAVAEILGECYRTFPLPAKLSRLDLGEKVKQYYPIDDPNTINMSDIEFQIAQYTLVWLKEAGYVWTDIDPKGNYSVQATLSPKGLLALNSVPESLKEESSVGAALLKGASVVGVTTIQTLVKQALGSHI